MPARSVPATPNVPAPAGTPISSTMRYCPVSAAAARSKGPNRNQVVTVSRSIVTPRDREGTMFDRPVTGFGAGGIAAGASNRYAYSGFAPPR